MRKFKIEIPQPCHEDWDQMTPESKGRFCASCQKNVIDFSDMNASDIAHTLKSQKNVCGRFAVDQLEETYTLPTRNVFYFPYQVAAASLLVFASPVFGQTVEPVKTETSPSEHLIGDTIMVGNPLYIAPIQINDESGRPVEKALVKIQTKEGIVVAKGTTNDLGQVDIQFEAKDTESYNAVLVSTDHSFSTTVCLKEATYENDRILLIAVKRNVDRPMIMGKIAMPHRR